MNQLKYLVNKYDISLDDLYVFGDGENDIDMLACTEDGVAKIIEKLL